MSAKKTTKKRGPGRGGKRAGAGRKPVPGSRRSVLCVRVTDHAKSRIAAAACARGVSPSALLQGWAESLPPG